MCIYVSNLIDWRTKRKVTFDFQTITAEELNVVLRKYYAEVKPEKGDKSLTLRSLRGLRSGVHRYIISPPFNRSMIIIKECEFTSANEMFQLKCKIYFQDRNPKPKHKPVIGEGDTMKMDQYFQAWNTNPEVLQKTTWFYLCFYFGHRAREWWTQVMKNTFALTINI